MPFSMQGLVQFSPKLVDGDATRSESVAVQMSLANGVGSGRANGYWSKTLTLAAGQDETIDLLSLPVSAFGASGTTGFAAVKHLAILNQSDLVSLTVEPGASDGWDQVGETVVGAAGILLLHSPLSGLPISGSSRTVAVSNNSAAPQLTEGDTTSGSTAITGLSSTSTLAAGMDVTGTGIPAGAKIASITSGTTVSLTEPAAATATAGSLTFSWPDAVAQVYVAGVLD